MAKPILYYWDMAGRAELIRLIAAAGGLEMEEKAELADKLPFGSPGSWPCLEHGDLKMAQSTAIEMYIASVSPKYKDLTPEQTATDAMYACIKEDMLDGYAQVLGGMMSDESKKATAAEDFAKVTDKWYPVVEGLLPASGFVNGLADPTMADLTIVNIAQGFMPFGAVKKISGQDPLTKYSKFKAHADRVAAHPSVKAYLDKTTSMAGNPFGI